MGLCITSITADIKMCNTRSFTTRSSVYFHGKYANLSNAYVYSRVVYGRVRGKYANFRWRMVTFTMCSKMLMEHIFEFIKKSTVSPVKFIDHFHPSKEFYAFRFRNLRIHIYEKSADSHHFWLDYNFCLLPSHPVHQSTVDCPIWTVSDVRIRVCGHCTKGRRHSKVKIIWEFMTEYRYVLALRQSAMKAKLFLLRINQLL